MMPPERTMHVEPAGNLSPRQHAVLETIVQYCETTREPCPASYVARRLRVHPTTVRGHLEALHRKGWLRTPHAPSSLTTR